MTVEFKPYTVSGIVRLINDMENGGLNAPDPADYSLIIYFQLAQIHSEMQTSFAKHLLDFSQGFLTEVAEFHQVFLFVGNQFAQDC